MVKRFILRGFFPVIFIFWFSFAFSDQSQRVILDVGAGAVKLEDQTWTLLGTGMGELDIQSKGSRNIKARINLQITMGQGVETQKDTTEQYLTGEDIDIFGIKYAYVKFRLPLTQKYDIRLSAGKNTLTWGMGRFYNAGNTVFGAEGSEASFYTVEGELREETDWYTSLFIPAGRFSFIESVFLLPPQGYTETGTASSLFPSPDETSLGARVFTKLFNTQLEISYLYRGAVEKHVPAFSIQGNFGPDFYMSSSCNIPRKIQTAQQLLESLVLSWGLLWLNPFPSSKITSLRVEGLLKPKGEWEQSHNGPSGSPTGYGIEIFPELIFSLSGRTTFIFREILSPVDLSALTVLGVDFNPNQGIHLYSFLSFQIGEKQDTFGFLKTGGMGIFGGIRYTY